MIWIEKYKRTWRAAVLLLLITAFTGPWIFDRIWVPAEYACSLPNIRLDKNFCGLPQSGIWLLTWLLDSFFRLATGSIIGEREFNDIVREIVFFSLLLLPVLPFFTTLRLIRQEDGRLRFHILVWLLAIIVGLWLSRSGFPWPHPASWGVWLYIGLAISILILERLALVVGRKSVQA